jgi:hypothetical protein
MVGLTPKQLGSQYDGAAHWDKYGLIVQQSGGGTPYKPMASWREARSLAATASLRRRAVAHCSYKTPEPRGISRAAAVAADLEAAAALPFSEGKPKVPSIHDLLLGDLVNSPQYKAKRAAAKPSLDASMLSS